MACTAGYPSCEERPLRSLFCSAMVARAIRDLVSPPFQRRVWEDCLRDERDSWRKMPVEAPLPVQSKSDPMGSLLDCTERSFSDSRAMEPPTWLGPESDAG